MPQIKQFDAPEGIGLRPSETGVEATASAARRIGSNYAEAGAALQDTGNRYASAIKAAGDVAADYAERREKSAGAKSESDVLANLTQTWNDTAKDAVKNGRGDDPSIAPRFREEVLEPALDKFRQGFLTEGGQKFAEAKTEALRNHFVEKTTADTSSMAGDAAKLNTLKTINTLGSTVYADPSSLNFARQTLKSSIDGMIDDHPGMTATQAAKLKTDMMFQGEQHLVRAAVTSAISKGADWHRIADDPANAPYVNQSEIETFARAAKTQQKTDLLAQKALETYTRQQNDQAVHVQSNKILADNVSIDPVTSRPVIKPDFFKQALDLVRQNPDAPNASANAKTLLDWGEHQQDRKPPIVSDPSTLKDLTDRMFDPDHPTTRIDLMKANAAGKISDHDFQTRERLVTELEQSPLKGPVWQATAAAVKNDLIVSIPGIPGKDNVGLENYARFMDAFIPQYQAKMRAGTLEPNALDVKNPDSMISKAMAPFKRTQAQRMNDYISAAGGLALPGSSNAPTSARKVGDVPVPAALGGIAALQYNKSTGQWRDQTSGKIYDKSGAEVAR